MIYNYPGRQFDALAQKHGVQKIDVIGDAYLAATNVIEDQVAIIYYILYLYNIYNILCI